MKTYTHYHPNNLPETLDTPPNSISSTLLKKNFKEVLQELQTNINTKRKARIKALQEKLKRTSLQKQ